MALAAWFWKRYNGDVTGVGKTPLRKRFSKFRQTQIGSRLQKFRDTRAGERTRAGAKKMQDYTGIEADTPVHLMVQPKPV